MNLDNAATLAAETLVKFNVKFAPVSPMKILEQMDNVIVISFSEMSERAGVDRRDILSAFGRIRDAITSIHEESGSKKYVVAYNRLLPFSMIQRALARELAHIVLQHGDPTEETAQEAECFANHLLCPRPLIYSIIATGIRFTEDMLANLTGVFDQTLISIRHTPGTNVTPGLNRFVRSQFMPFILNFLDYYRTVMPKDGSAIADLGSFMDGYEE